MGLAPLIYFNYVYFDNNVEILIQNNYFENVRQPNPGYDLIHIVASSFKF